MPPKRDTILQLARRLKRLETARRLEETGVERRSTGVPALDGWLPERGLPRGTLVEWLSDRAAETLAFRIAAHLRRGDAPAVVVDPGRTFYPPAAVRLGIPAERLVVVHPATGADALWALEQTLACRGAGVVVAWLGEVDGRAFRRLQLAAERGHTTGMLLRPARCRAQPSWAEVRLLVRPRPGERAGPERTRRIAVEMLHCRGSLREGLLLEIDDETGDVHPVPPLAAAAGAIHAAGA